MKNLVIAALASMGSLALTPGCIIVAEDDDPGGPGGNDDVGIQVSWNLIGLGDTPDGCAAAGVTTIEAVSDPSPDVEGDEFRDLFDCADLVHTTAPLPTDTYDVYINAWSGDVDSTLIAQSGFLTASSGGSVDFDNVLHNAAFFSLGWTLVDSANADVTCAQAGATGVAVDLTSQPDGALVPAGIFTCEDGGAVADPAFLGDYSISVAALDSSDLVVGEPAPAIEDALVLGNEVRDLGDVLIPVN